MKNCIFCLIVVLLIFQSDNTVIAATPVITEMQAQIMSEEYQVVRQMRHSLRFLLERQEVENILQESEDVFQDLQQMEQWLEQLKQESVGENMEELLSTLERMEERMKLNLESQEKAGQWLQKKQAEGQRIQIPLSSMMDTLRELIRTGRFDKAQELLDRLLSAMNRQQQGLEQALANENRERFSETNRQLQQLLSQAQKALTLEKLVQDLLQPHTSRWQIPGDARKQAAKLQRQISELIRRMQSGLQQFPESALLNTRVSMEDLQQSHESSQNTENRLEQSQPMPAFHSVLNTQNRLKHLTQNLRNLQQQAQQLSNNRMIAKRDGNRRRYWSEKGIRPMKFEYKFQANPLFREKIQQQDSRDSQRRTKLQQQYLQEVMR